MKGVVRVWGLLALLICTASLAPAQVQWRQVYKAASQIQSLKIIRPIDTTIAPSVMINQGAVGWAGVFCWRYDPTSEKLIMIGPDSSGSFVYTSNNSFRFASCAYTIWQDDAAYDTSRHLLSAVGQGHGGWLYDNYQWLYYDYWEDTTRLMLNGTSLDSSCVFTYVLNDLEAGPYPYPARVVAVQKIFFHPSDGTILFSLLNSGLAKLSFQNCPPSLASWPIIKAVSAPEYFYIDRDNPQLLFLTSADTLWQSTDAGISWFVAVLANITSITRSPGTNIFVAGSNDSLTHGLYQSENNGVAFHQRSTDFVYSLDADQTTGIVYAGAHGAILMCRNSGNNISVFDSISARDNIVGIAAISGKIIYADSGGVYETDAASDVQEVFTPGVSSVLTNYPNPFTTSTTISMNAPMSGTHNNSVLNIFDMLGRNVLREFVTLRGGHITATFDGSDLPAGIYRCELRMGRAVAERRILLVK